MSSFTCTGYTSSGVQHQIIWFDDDVTYPSALCCFSCWCSMYGALVQPFLYWQTWGCSGRAYMVQDSRQPCCTSSFLLRNPGAMLHFHESYTALARLALFLQWCKNFCFLAKSNRSNKDQCLQSPCTKQYTLHISHQRAYLTLPAPIAEILD